jgi:hypothetical protein
MVSGDVWIGYGVENGWRRGEGEKVRWGWEEQKIVRQRRRRRRGRG